MGVGAGLYMYVVVVQKFTFAISSPDEFLSSQDPDVSEQIILKKLNDLNVTKSPGPDNIHPRILYELRHELVLLLKNIV